MCVLKSVFFLFFPCLFFCVQSLLGHVLCSHDAKEDTLASRMLRRSSERSLCVCDCVWSGAQMCMFPLTCVLVCYLFVHHRCQVAVDCGRVTGDWIFVRAHTSHFQMWAIFWYSERAQTHIPHPRTAAWRGVKNMPCVGKSVCFPAYAIAYSCCWSQMLLVSLLSYLCII